MITQGSKIDYSFGSYCQIIWRDTYWSQLSEGEAPIATFNSFLCMGRQQTHPVDS
jgi:hypothetical protein